MKLLLRILLFPITFTLTILLAISKLILCVGGGVLGLVALLFFVIGIGGMITADYQTVGIPALIFAYLLSPFGLPLIGVFIIGNVELFRDWLRELA